MPRLVRFSLLVVVLACGAWAFGRFVPSFFYFHTGSSRPCELPGQTMWITNRGAGVQLTGGTLSLAWGYTNNAVGFGTPHPTKFTWVRPKAGMELPGLAQFAYPKYFGFGALVNRQREGGGPSLPPHRASWRLSLTLPLWFLVALGSTAPVRHWLRRRNNSGGTSVPQGDAPAHEPIEARRAA